MPNYKIIPQKNTNLGWWFYKGYYKGGLDWSTLNNKDDNNKAYFDKANDVLKQAKLSQLPQTQGGYTPQYQTTYPGLLMGVGYQHETGAMGEAKIGFYFDYTTGLPCLPGSSVKGIIRSAFPQFKPLEGNYLAPDSQNRNRNKNNRKDNIALAQAKARYIAHALGWTYQANEDEALFTDVYQLELAIFAGVDLPKTTATDLEYVSIYKRDIFHDAFPKALGNKLLGMDNITPHVGGAKSKAEIIKKSLKEPTPILFLKIMPEVSFQFDFKIAESDFKIGNKTITPKNRQTLYDCILKDFGVGAKTNLGYGQFQQVIEEIKSKPKPEFLHKGTFNPKKRYDLEAIVTKSGAPNLISVYVEEGKIQENVKLDTMRNPIEEGTVIKIMATVVNSKVTQASYTGDKR